jgi:hypothetical protein
MPPAPAPSKPPKVEIADPVSDEVWEEVSEDEGFALWEESDFFKD